MKYCSECGSAVARVPQQGRAPSRFVCKACDAVFFRAPRLATACIAEWERKILLCRRAVAPEHGQWELPAGFVASGESISAAAVRETLEEANVEVVIERPYALLHIPHADQLRVVYLARLLAIDFKRGPETSEARLFDEREIPWEQLAFATTRDTLRRYFADRRAGVLGFFFAEIVPLTY